MTENDILNVFENKIVRGLEAIEEEADTANTKKQKMTVSSSQLMMKTLRMKKIWN